MQAAYSYLRADCELVLLDIIDCCSIIVKVYLKARGFTEFTREPYRYRTVSFHYIYTSLDRSSSEGNSFYRREIVSIRGNEKNEKSYLIGGMKKGGRGKRVKEGGRKGGREGGENNVEQNKEM